MQQHRRHGRYVDAASALGRATLVSPSSPPRNLVEAVEREAGEELRGLIHIVEPNESRPIGSNLVEVIGSVDDRVHGAITIGGKPVVPSAGKFRQKVDGLREGRNPISVRVKQPDEVEIAFSIYVTVDTTAPKLNVLSPIASKVVSLPVKLTGTVKDDSAVEVRCRDQRTSPNEDGEWILHLKELDDGPVDLEIVATDAAGISDTRKLRLVVDSTPPVVETVSGSRFFSTRIAGIKVLMRAFDPHLKSVTVESIETPVAKDGSFEIKFARSGELDGESHTTCVTVLDEADNSATCEVIVLRDTSAPTVRSIELSKSDLFPGSTFVLQGSIEDLSECTLTLNGIECHVSENGSVSSPTITVPSEQRHGEPLVLKGEARDAAGNSTPVELAPTIYKPCERCKPIAGIRGLCWKCRGLGVRIDPPCEHSTCKSNPNVDGVDDLCMGCLEKLDSAETCRICKVNKLCNTCSGTGHDDPALIKSRKSSVAAGLSKKQSLGSAPARSKKPIDASAAVTSQFPFEVDWTGEYQARPDPPRKATARVVSVNADKVVMKVQVAGFAPRHYHLVVAGSQVVLAENQPAGLLPSGGAANLFRQIEVAGSIDRAQLSLKGEWDIHSPEGKLLWGASPMTLLLRRDRTGSDEAPAPRAAPDASVAVLSLVDGRLLFSRPIDGYWSSPVEISAGVDQAAIAKSINGIYEVIGLLGTSLIHFRSIDGKDWSRGESITAEATGPGAIALGKLGNLLVVVPERSGLVHYWSEPGKKWQRSNVVTSTATKAASIAIGPGGNYEVLALHGSELTHYRWPYGGSSWNKTGVITGQATACGSIARGYKGNFEVVVLEGTALRHYWARPGEAWNRGVVISSSATGAGAIAFTLGKRFEVVVPEGDALAHYWAEPRQLWVRSGEVVGSDGTLAAAVPTSD